MIMTMMVLVVVVVVMMIAMMMTMLKQVGIGSQSIIDQWVKQPSCYTS